MSPKTMAYPDPLVVAPQTTDHTHTLVLLHGRGSNAERFGLEFLETTDLCARLPTVKFVFPTASKRRSRVLKKIPINQWFDYYSLEDPGQRTDLQVDGLCQTAEFLRELVAREAGLLGEGGYQRVILGGLSQGCAASVFALLGGGHGPGGNEALGGFIGMSGWLPFEQQLQDLSQSLPSGENIIFSSTPETDPFASSAVAEDATGDLANLRPLEAVNHIRDILDLPWLDTQRSAAQSHWEEQPSSNSSAWKPVVDYLQVPVFIGHGALDPKLPVELGEQMTDFLLTRLRMNVMWKVYEQLGHWYGIPDEIEDIITFLELEVKVPVR